MWTVIQECVPAAHTPGQVDFPMTALLHYSSLSPGDSDREPLTEDGGIQDPARREVRGRDPKAISPERRCKLEAERLNRTPGVNLKAK